MIGQIIESKEGGDSTGDSVALSANGHVVAIGSFGYDNGNYDNYYDIGLVRVFETCKNVSIHCHLS